MDSNKKKLYIIFSILWIVCITTGCVIGVAGVINDNAKTIDIGVAVALISAVILNILFAFFIKSLKVLVRTAYATLFLVAMLFYKNNLTLACICGGIAIALVLVEVIMAIKLRKKNRK